MWLALGGWPHAVWVPMAVAAASTCRWTWAQCMAPALSIAVVLAAVVAAGSRVVVTVFAIVANSQATSC